MIEIVLDQCHKQQVGEGELGGAGGDGRAAGMGLFGDGIETVVRALLQTGEVPTIRSNPSARDSAR